MEDHNFDRNRLMLLLLAGWQQKVKDTRFPT
jgi:hypothetical protein